MDDIKTRAIDYEKSVHNWLDEDQLKRIVEDNLADDPEFYAFLDDVEDEVKGEVDQAVAESTGEKPCGEKKKKNKNADGFAIIIEA